MVSDQEIQREIDSLRSFRRRSASSGGPGAIPLDPDLPPASSPGPSSSSPPKHQWFASSQSHSPPTSPVKTGSPISVFNRTRSGSIERLGLDTPLQAQIVNEDNEDMPLRPEDDPYDGMATTNTESEPSQLFWVPARLHPELAPGEFRAFLKTHSHTDSDGVVDGVGEATGALANPVSNTGGSSPGLARSPSWLARSGKSGSGDLGRKRSMLSRQYQPKANDGVESEAPPLPSEASMLRRAASNRTSIYGGITGDQGVTLQDLQKLETMVEGVGLSDDPAHMRSLLKRNLSMNASQQYLDDHPEGTELLDDADTPIIPALPGQILRRSARTRIRKPNLVGDGGGHRFGASRKGRTAITGDEDQFVPADGSPNPQSQPYEEEERRPGHLSDDSDEMYSAESGQPGDTQGGAYNRKLSTGSTEESAIFESYVDSSAETSIESSSTIGDTSESGVAYPYQDQTVGIPASTEQDEWRESERTPTQSDYQSQNRAAIVGYGAGQPSRGEEDAYARLYTNPPPQAPLVERTPPPTNVEPLRQQVVPPRPMQRQASSESLSKKPKDEKKKGGFFSSKKDKDKDSKGKKGEKKEKEGFLGSLFGSKKKSDEPAPLKFSAAGPAAAAALLGSSKSAKSLGLIPMNGNSPTSPGFSPYARYPIHVERAIYRLSHIKLANPRRPLYEQVLISNLMFWYLGVINKPATPPQATTEEKPKPVEAAEVKEVVSSGTTAASEKTPAFKTLRSTSPAPSRSSPSPTPPPVSPEPSPAPKRIGLSKPDPNRTRTAETPVRPPQYGIQNMQMQQEYGRSSGGPPGAMSSQRGPPPQPPSPSQSAGRRSTASPTPSIRQTEERQGGLPRSTRSQDVSSPPAPHIVPPRHTSPPPTREPPRLQVVTDHYRGQPPNQRSVNDRSPSGSPYTAYQPDGLPRPHHPEGLPRERKSPQEAPPRSPSSPRSGIQPGQIFHHPNMNIQPGQAFPSHHTSPGQPVGQVFSHPHYPSPPGHPGYHAPHEEHRDLPPGAMPPRSTQQPQQWRHAPPPQSQHPPRPMNGYEIDQTKRSTSGGYPQSQSMNPGPRSLSAGDPRMQAPLQQQASQSEYMRSPPLGSRGDGPYNWQSQTPPIQHGSPQQYHDRR